jgi:transposase
MIREEGYEGGESILRAHIARIRPPSRTAYLTLNFAPGEAAQVDFASCGTIRVGETRTRLHVFVMTLCHSRMIYAEFILRQNMEHFLQCHRNAFEYFGGVPAKVMVDNCKVAIDSPSLRGEPVVNRHYADLASHYGFRVVACGVRKPHEKGRVERGIGYLRQNFLDGLETGTFAAMNCGLRHWMENVANVRVHGATRKQPAELFKADLEAMKSLCLFPYDCRVTHTSRVNRQYRVVFETNRYSAPPELVGKLLEINVYPLKLLLSYEGKAVAEHGRSYEKYRDIVDPEHDKALIERRRLARNSQLLGRFLALGDVAEKYYRGLCEKRLNPGLHVRKITALADIYGTDDVKRAMADSIESGAFSSDCVLNILESRRRPLPEPGPLHLTRKSDCLDIDLGQTDLAIYDINTK